MSISANGQSQVPPGFRFHPTEEELLQYYLKKKVSYEKIDLDVIRDVDLNNLEPWDIQEKCKIGTTPQNDWYFFSHKDKKYPTGTRTNRATAMGFWKATGRDKVICSNGKRIGMRKTLVFYRGRAPYGQKSDWIMHEYRLDDDITTMVSNAMEDAAQEVGRVVCKIFKKKNLLKSPSASSIAGETGGSHLFDSRDEGALEQILEQMGKGYMEEENYEANYSSAFDADVNNGGYHDKLLELPSLGSPKSMNMDSQQNNNNNGYHPIIPVEMVADKSSFITRQVNNLVHPMAIGRDWSTMDQLVASQLNGQSEASRQLACFNNPTMGFCTLEHDLQLQLPTLLSLSSSSSIISSSSTPTRSWATTCITPTQDHTSEIGPWNFA